MTMTWILCAYLIFFVECGIVHQTSCVGTPQQNKRVERKRHHILNVARSLLFQADLLVKFWGESVSDAIFLINRTPSKLLKGNMPYQCLYGKEPLYENVKVFGCFCFVHRSSSDKDKFSKRSRRCIFFGYPFGKRAGSFMILKKMSFFGLS